MKIIRSLVGWICTVFTIVVIGAVFGINTMHTERDETGKITGVKYD